MLSEWGVSLRLAGGGCSFKFTSLSLSKMPFFFSPAILQPCQSFIKYSSTLHLVHQVTSEVRAQNQEPQTVRDMTKVISVWDAASPPDLDAR